MGAINHDLDLGESDIKNYPFIKGLLRDEELIKAFKLHDALARKAKSWFHGLGVAALILGMVGLILALAEIVSPGFHLPTWSRGMSLSGPCCAVVAIVIYWIMQLCRFREKWLSALFVRERIRQWHFQRFMDGKLVSDYADMTTRHQAQNEFGRRWQTFYTSISKDPGAAMDSYLKRKEEHPKWDHPQSAYPNAPVAGEVFQALSSIRFEHQIQFSIKKTLASGHEITLAPNERDRISEWLARSTFIAAIICAAVQTLVFGYQAMQDDNAHITHLHEAGLALNALAVLFAILSAGIRVYRTGYTLPAESESYQHYLDLCEIYEREWTARAYDPLTLALDTAELRNIETEAYRELKRFLTIKRAASFLF